MYQAPLGDLLSGLRAELGHSTNVAHGVNDRETLIYYLNRTQIQLYQDYDWPQLIVDRDQPLFANGRYYPYPADLQFDDISSVHVMVGDLVGGSYFQEMTYGIGTVEMNLLNSDAGFTQWPPLKWMHNADDNTIEVWPVPDDTALFDSTGHFIRLRGTKTVLSMVNDGDLSTLPPHLVILFAAVEILERDDAKDAALKLNKANEAMRRHRVRQASHKRIRATAIGAGGGDAQSRRHYPPAIGLDYIPSGYGSGPIR
jgi:hypothetical protein